MARFYVETGSAPKTSLSMFSSKYTGSVALTITTYSAKGKHMSKRIELSPLEAQALTRPLQDADKERLAACGYVDQG